MNQFEHLTRQMDILPMNLLPKPITVIGAGAIGSFTVLSLAKMGFSDITVYDFDTISVENMNCQFYRHKDIGKSKVEALRDLIKDFTEMEIKIVNDKFTTQKVEGIVISAVDSMEVRANIWKQIKGRPFVNWLIDPRMAAEYALNYVIDPNDKKDQITYEKTLYTDAAAVQERCTAKSTMYTATMIAGYVAKSVKDIVTKGDYARVSHWDIAKNNLLNWPKVKGEGNAAV